MDTKKLILAIALSIIVITLYQYLFIPKPEVKPTRIPEQEKVETVPTQTTTETPPKDISEIFSGKEKEEKVVEKKTLPVEDDLKDSAIKDIVVDTELFRVTFTNKGAGMKSFVLKKYNDDTGQPLELISKKVEKFGLLPFYFSPFEDNEVFRFLNSENFLYSGDLNLEVGENGERELVFKYADKSKDLFVSKKFIVSEGSYLIGTDFEIQKDGQLIEAPIVFGPDLENNINEDRTMLQNLKVASYNGTEMKSIEFVKLKTERLANQSLERAAGVLEGFFFWSSYQTTYFAAIFKPRKRDTVIKFSVVKEKLKKDQQQLYSYIIILNPEVVYMGPKDEKLLSSISEIFPEVNDVIEYGWFGSIAKIMLKGINFVYYSILKQANYGWALIIFTIFLKILLFPLTYSSSVSMAKMQALQPKMKAIKKKYKNTKDPEQRKAMNMELMALYKSEKVNPAGGCLPMLLQLPILWGFFRLLAVSINVRHESWMLWIKDLSIKDPFYVLPILMGITQIILQKMSPTGADSSQKKIMYIMPVVIVLFVMNLPSGLNLYWFASNLLQIGQQHIINERIHKKKKLEEKQKKSGKKKKRG